MTAAVDPSCADPDRVVRVGDLVCMHDIAKRVGVADVTITMWRSRHEDFPRPLVYRRGFGLIFVWPDVEEWIRKHRKGKP